MQSHSLIGVMITLYAAPGTSVLQYSDVAAVLPVLQRMATAVLQCPTMTKNIKYIAKEPEPHMNAYKLFRYVPEYIGPTFQPY